ncbi:MAG: alpha/beta hydrolase [Candidatus Izemoplasmatales bacterium]
MKKIIDGIPLIEYFDVTKTTYAGVVFLVHGHTGNKELYGLESLPRGFVERGYFVISIDAYKHGERKEEPYFSNDGLRYTLAMPEVVIHTIKDIIHLYNHYYKQVSPKLIVTGTSMGGHIAFQMPKYNPEVNTILPFIGSPDMKNHYEKTKGAFLQEKIALVSKEIEELEIIDLTPYMNVNIGVFNGALDTVVEIKYVQPFIDQLIDMNHPQVHFESFECGHTVPEEMVKAMFHFFDTLR